VIRPRLAFAAGLVGGLLGAGALAGCTTLGGNIKGDFACRAPDGICAPSATIDDQALALISGEDGDRLVAPAGPYLEPPAEGRGFQKASAPVRTRERVLRIVFPAQIDAAGRLHEQTAVHAVVEQGNWAEALAASAIATSREDVAAATGADTLLAAVERADPPLIDMLPIDSGVPSAEAVALARSQTGPARAASTDPVGDIKDQVTRTLLTPRGTPTALPPAKRAPTAAANVTPAQAATPAAAPPAPVASDHSSPRPVASTAPSIAVPKFATPEGKAAIAAVAANPAIRAGLDRGESEANMAAQNPAVPMLRAAPFPGLQP